MDDATFWLVVAAVLFGLDAVLALLGDAIPARVRLISAGLLALTIALIVERN